MGKNARSYDQRFFPLHKHGLPWRNDGAVLQTSGTMRPWSQACGNSEQPGGALTLIKHCVEGGDCKRVASLRHCKELGRSAWHSTQSLCMYSIFVIWFEKWQKKNYDCEKYWPIYSLTIIIGCYGSCCYGCFKHEMLPLCCSKFTLLYFSHQSRPTVLVET